MEKDKALFTLTTTAPDGRLFSRMGAFFYEFQRAATGHVAEMALTGIRENHLLWVLNRMQVEIFQLPEAGEKLCLRTWPNPQTHGLFPRQYRIERETGECMLRAVAIWTLMDSRSRTMQKGEGLGPKDTWVDPLDLPRPKGLPAFPCATVDTRMALPEEMDENGHINNSHYVRWMEPLITEEFESQHALQYFQINYLAEIRQGMEVELCAGLEGTTLRVEGRVEGHRSFAARADFI